MKIIIMKKATLSHVLLFKCLSVVNISSSEPHSPTHISYTDFSVVTTPEKKARACLKIPLPFSVQDTPEDRANLEHLTLAQESDSMSNRTLLIKSQKKLLSHLHSQLQTMKSSSNTDDK